MSSQVISVDINKRKKTSKRFIFPTTCLCGAKTRKEISNNTKKEDAVEDVLRDMIALSQLEKNLNILFLKKL